MGGPVIVPPNYVAYVGPTKNIRRAPDEVDARGGGKEDVYALWLLW
jgi:hypothetical protein